MRKTENKTKVFSWLIVIIILLPFMRFYATEKILVRSIDYNRHLDKINSIYTPGFDLPEESKFMESYPSFFHKLMYNLSLRNIENVGFVSTFILVLFLSLYRFSFYLLFKRFGKAVAFILMFCFLELPYILPMWLASILQRTLYEFPIGFWSLELFTIHVGTLPSFIVAVLSMLSLSYPVMVIPAFLSTFTTRFSGMALFYSFMLIGLIKSKNYKIFGLLFFAVSIIGYSFSKQVIPRINELLFSNYAIQHRWIVTVVTLIIYFVFFSNVKKGVDK